MSLSVEKANLGNLDVSRETSRRLHAYVRLLEKWNPVINLVSRASLEGVWARHVLDSAQLLAVAPDHVRLWADLGSGGGFPGAVVAVLAAERRPEMEVTLVESDARKAEFLRAVARETDVPMNVLCMRIEKLPPLRADLLSARALAPLHLLCDFAARHLSPGGTALFPKGAQAATEVEEARKAWRFDLESHPSVTDSQAIVLELRNISHV